jgi:hypothetical protein
LALLNNSQWVKFHRGDFIIFKPKMHEIIEFWVIFVISTENVVMWNSGWSSLWNVHFCNAILCLACIIQNWGNGCLWMDTMDNDDLGYFCFFFFGVILFVVVYVGEQGYWSFWRLALVFGCAFFNSRQKWEPCNWFQKCTTRRLAIYGRIANGVWGKVKYHSFACWAREIVYVCVKLIVYIVWSGREML